MLIRKAIRNSYRKRIYASIMLVALLPISILGVFAYYTYISELSEKLDAYITANAHQTRDRTDHVLSSIKEYYIEIYTKAEIQWLMRGDAIDYNQHARLSAANEELRGSLSFVEYIAGYSFVNLENNWVVSSQGMYRLNKTVNLAEFTTLMDELEASGSRLYWLNRLAQGKVALSRSNQMNLNGYMLVLRLPTIGVETRSVLIVNLDAALLQRLATGNMENYGVVVLDQNAEIFSSNHAGLAAYCQEHFSSLRFQNGASRITIEGGEQYHIATTHSSVNGLTFVVGYNQSDVVEGADRILTFAVVLFLIVLLLVLLSWLGTGWIYRPVNRLISFMNKAEGTDETVKEFEQIENKVIALVSNNENMEKIIGTQLGMLTELFLLRLIHGELDPDKIDEHMVRLRLQSCPCYSLISVRVLAGDEQNASLDEDALQILLIENMPQEITDMLYTCPVTSNGAVVLLLAGNTHQQPDEQILLLYEALQKHARDALNRCISMGVSRSFDNLSQLHDAFHEAIEALKNKAVELGDSVRYGGIVFYSDLLLNVVAATRYDTLVERDTQEAIDKCNVNKAVAAVDEFVNSLTGEGVALHEKSLHLNRFLVALLTVPQNAGLSINEVYKCEKGGLFEQAQGLYNAEELKRFLINRIILPAIEALEQFRENRVPVILEQVITLIKERHGNISLSECADQLGYHPGYIWKVLKSQENMTFTDFVSGEKLEIAKEMLLNTDYSIADIADILNYTNAQNFIRFFSKHVGVTPGNFRKEHSAEKS